MAHTLATTDELQAEIQKLQEKVYRSQLAAERHIQINDYPAARQETELAEYYYAEAARLQQQLHDLTVQHDLGILSEASPEYIESVTAYHSTHSDIAIIEGPDAYSKVMTVRDRMANICPERGTITAKAAIRLCYGTRDDLWPEHLRETYAMLCLEGDSE